MLQTSLRNLPNNTFLGSWGNRHWYLKSHPMFPFTRNYTIVGSNGFSSRTMTYPEWQLLDLMNTDYTRTYSDVFTPTSHLDLIKNTRRI